MAATCTIADVYLHPSTQLPVPYARIRVTLGNTPVTGTASSVYANDTEWVTTSATGAWSVSLVPAALLHPTTTTAVLTFPNGEQFAGQVPNVAGPLTVATLLASYGWGAPASTSLTVVQGPPGLLYRGSWSSSATYAVNDVVTYNGSSYVALAINTNVTPAVGATWNLIAQIGLQGTSGPRWTGNWSSATSYVVGDVALSNGSSYICQVPHSNQPPPNASYWSVFAAKGDPGPTGPTGSGSTADATATTTGAVILDINPPSGHPVVATRDATRARSWLRV